MDRLMQPDSQTKPFGPKQLAWIKDWIIAKNFRDQEDGTLIKPLDEEYQKLKKS